MFGKSLFSNSINILILTCLFSVLSSAEKQNKPYFSWLVGNSSDFKLPDESVLNGGILLAGGSDDVDEAMKWFLRKALGGDVIVFRNAQLNALPSSTANAYNNYLYSELGIDVNSVETILLNSPDVANNLEVYEKVKKAEAIFFTGGDQLTYYKFIKTTLLEDALDHFINIKRGVIGGTSAGCAIQGEHVFTAEFDTITSDEALKNPFNKKMTIRNDFFNHQILRDTITDTHFHQRDREGRLISFMARIITGGSQDSLIKGIGVDEATAVCVESNRRAYVYGNQSAYFMRQTSNSSLPERCESGKSLDWYSNKQAVRVYKINGSPQGRGYLDLNNWETGSMGEWFYYYVDMGRMLFVKS